MSVGRCLHTRDLGRESKIVAENIKCFTAVGTEDGKDLTEGGIL